MSALPPALTADEIEGRLPVSLDRVAAWSGGGWGGGMRATLRAAARAGRVTT